VRDERGVDHDYVESGTWEINVGGVLVPAKASLRAMYDPKGHRSRT